MTSDPIVEPTAETTTNSTETSDLIQKALDDLRRIYTQIEQSLKVSFQMHSMRSRLDSTQETILRDFGDVVADLSDAMHPSKIRVTLKKATIKSLEPDSEYHVHHGLRVLYDEAVEMAYVVDVGNFPDYPLEIGPEYLTDGWEVKGRTQLLDDIKAQYDEAYSNKDITSLFMLAEMLSKLVTASRLAIQSVMAHGIDDTVEACKYTEQSDNAIVEAQRFL